ncbi:MAG: microcystin degradation protein MlrC [Planctomycetota bacterium]|jgi:microcystin degradation protein MlrC
MNFSSFFIGLLSFQADLSSHYAPSMYTRLMKVLSAEINHESNTFCRRKTDLQAFRDRCFLFDAVAIKARGQANTELAGFLQAADKFDWELVHIISASAGPGGKVTSQAFESLCKPLIEAAAQNDFDGILLGLHGAMVTDFCEDGEGEILQRLRTVVGPDIPIAITLDLHANVTKQMCRLADIMVSYKTYPHVDMRDAGIQAGEILERTMRGEIKPHTIRASRAMLEEVNGGRTDIGPMIDRIAKAKEYETNQDVFAVSINGGFASSDIAEIGPTVLVTAQGDFNAHTAFAESIADDIWNRRKEVLNDYMSVEAAAGIAASFASAKGPLIIADYADNPGAGAYGDSTALLAALLDADIEQACFGPMVDAQTVSVLHAATIGERVKVSLGGKFDANFGGGPLVLDVELVSISDGEFVGDGPMMGGLQGSFGPSAVIRVKGFEILVVSIASQMLDLQQFKAFGIDPQNKRVVALKSMQHFRAAFAPIAGKIIVCDSGALCTPDYQRMTYHNVPTPIYPLDQ